MSLSQERLKEVLHYDPATGDFTWLVSRHHSRVGRRAGSLQSNGYVHVKVDCGTYGAHRLAWFYMTGEWPDDQIDHIDRDKANNRWENLRPATNLQNIANRGSWSKSGFKGVYKPIGRNDYRTEIRINGKRKLLGYFKTPEEAHAVYVKAANDVHGEFARAA
jgi:hypothetical protein